jgi:hypothetical protein
MFHQSICTLDYEKVYDELLDLPEGHTLEEGCLHVRALFRPPEGS